MKIKMLTRGEGGGGEREGRKEARRRNGNIAKKGDGEIQGV
jgi:hypothetical protein